MSTVTDRTKHALAVLRKMLGSYELAWRREEYAKKLQQQFTSLLQEFHVEQLPSTCNCGCNKSAPSTMGAGGVDKEAAGLEWDCSTPSGTNLQSRSGMSVVAQQVPVNGQQPSAGFHGVADTSERTHGDILVQHSPGEFGWRNPTEVDWPQETHVIVEGVCPNPRLLDVCLLLEGGRKGRRCSMWKGVRGFRPGQVVPVRLDRGGRDAVYLPV